MLRTLFVLCFALLVALPAQAQTERNDVYKVVDNPPELIGGLDGLAERIVYPEAAKEAGLEGTVFVQFVVDERGDVQDARVIRGSSPELEAEALRVVRTAEFRPGMHQGEPAKVMFALPIKFQL